MSATVSVRDNTSRTLDARPSSDESVSATDVTDASRLARLLTRMLADLAALRRRFAPRRTTFRDIVSTGDAVTPYRVQLAHGFGAAVEWSIVGVKGAGVVAVTLVNEVDALTDANTLALDIYFPATLAIRLEET